MSHSDDEARKIEKENNTGLYISQRGQTVKLIFKKAGNSKLPKLPIKMKLKNKQKKLFCLIHLLCYCCK